MQIPVIESSRLLLVPPSAACEAVYEQFYTDEQASQFYGGPTSAAAAWNRLAMDLGAWHLQGFGVWAIQRLIEEDFVGVCGFWQGKGWPRELTWWLLPTARGRGIAAEASRAVINHAYAVFGWQRVETYMEDHNEPARSLVLRLGGQKDRRVTFPDGKQRDVFHLPRQSAA